MVAYETSTVWCLNKKEASILKRSLFQCRPGRQIQNINETEETEENEPFGLESFFADDLDKGCCVRTSISSLQFSKQVSGEYPEHNLIKKGYQNINEDSG